jgi:hypothetical protein
MTDCEIRLACLWYNEDCVAVYEIARRLRRNAASIWERLGADDPFDRGVGNKPSLTEANKDALVKLTADLVKKADVRYTVTAEMIKTKFRPSVSVRTLREALHERGVWFHKLRRKPILTDQDVNRRWKWAKAFRRKSKTWWIRNAQAPQVHIDNHAVKVPTNGDARKMLAAKRVHGTYRPRGDSLKKEHVKASDKLRMNTGARSVLIAGGVGAGKVLLWHAVEKQWCGTEAAAMYSGPLSAALKKQYPRKRKFRVLEDNDPSGYQTKLAFAAKKAKKMETFEIPKRSPDLNVMDYFVWSEVEKRLRETERSWPEGRKETREQFIKRLRKTARSIPGRLINKAIGDLARRANLLYRAEGGLFDESKELSG